MLTGFRTTRLRTSNTEKEVEKYDAQRSIFDEIRGVWIADETRSRVFDISSRSKQNLRSKRRSKIAYAYLKTGFPNLLHGCDFLFLLDQLLMSLRNENTVIGNILEKREHEVRKVTSGLNCKEHGGYTDTNLSFLD